MNDAGGGDRGGVGGGAGDHTLRAVVIAETFGGIQPVLDRDDRGVVAHQRRGLRRCTVGVVRFHPEQNEIHRADVGGGIGGRRADDELVENIVVGDFAQRQAVGTNGVEMRPARNEGHVMPRAREPAADISADCPGAEDCDFHAHVAPSS